MIKKLLISIFLITVIGVSSIFGYSYFQNSSDEITMIEPIPAHHHFRMQIINDGQYIDFSGEEFQESYVPGQCSGGLTETPIHFHDGLDQIVHIHYDKITGGEVLKYYGINLIGGSEDRIIYKPEENIIKTELPIRGNLIEASKDKDNYWIYTGSSDNFENRSVDEFLDQDLETFFGKKSKLTIQREEAKQTSLLGTIRVNAHDDHSQVIKDSESGEIVLEPTQEELKEIQNLIGDVVIFIQDQEPSQEMITERFNNLVKLQNSVCGG